MKTTNTFLKFKDPNKTEPVLWSVADLINVGCPIISDGENEGDDMELVSDDLYDKDGNPLKK